MATLSFLVQVILISLSGVMAPGAVTTAVIALSPNNKHAGAAVAVGHGILEIPLIFLLMFGLGKLLETNFAQIFIGSAGGAFLLWMAIGMLRQSRKSSGEDPSASMRFSPVTTGFILSATNPYFLLWWASVGLNLAVAADKLGNLTFVLFALVHWLCDLVWLEFLSLTANKGTDILGSKVQRYILMFCGAAMLIFALKFIYNAASLLLQTIAAV